MTSRFRAMVVAAFLAPLAAQAQGTARPAVPLPSQAVVPVDWRLLGQLDYERNIAPDTLKALDGRRVQVPGFIVPLDDAEEQGAEFLLVPYYGACVHTPPPPPNQMAFVTMQGGRAVKLALFDAVWLEGILRIVNYDSPYGSVGFTIEGISMRPYTGK